MMLKHELDRLKAAIETLAHTLAHLDEVHSQVVRLHRTFSVLFYVVVVSLIVGNLIAWCGGKSAPISTPIATPTAITPEKGVIGPETGPSNNRLQGITTSEKAPGRPYGDSVSSPWRDLVVYDLNEPAFDAGDLATKAARAFLGCEVKGWLLAGNAPKDAVGAVGERGAPQIHPSWRQKMTSMGLDLEVERDRWTFALWLAEVSGWQNWFYCQHAAEGADGTSGEY